MPAKNPTGVYETEVELPPGLKEEVAAGARRVVLHVGAADNCCFVRARGAWKAFWTAR